MALSSFRQRLLIAALSTLAVSVFAAIPASAQEITYYNFDTPATASPAQYTYACSASNPASNPLFCFNYAGSNQDPLFIQDPANSGPWATQMTYSEPSQAASMWFSIPQKVAEGFNVWFQFKITPSSNSGNTADGIAFVIHNAQGVSGTDPSGSCSETGYGPTVVGSAGGCMGYGGIDNSLALEFDTYYNSNFGDPQAHTSPTEPTYNDNHIALQDCGAGNINSPDHNICLVTLAATQSTPAVSTLIPNPASSSTGNVVTLADGNVHDVVIVYNGPLDTPANTISVYLDPQYNQGTHTPVAGSTPIFTGPFDITQAINLLNSGSANDSAYVGFTAGTGAAFETHEIMAWTFTPHTTVTQQQPLNSPGTPTTFNFGTHTYSVNYPSGAQTSGVSMGVIATTISPGNFASLIGLGPTQYTGSACQVYDDTGGNCIIYSEYCFETGSPSDVQACPAPQTLPSDCQSNPDATDCIDLTSTYNNSVQPTSPGYLQGDPLFSPVTSITGNGTTATVTCTGECAVTGGETISILDTNDNPEFTGITVNSAGLTTNTFTFSSTFNGTDNGGFLTSNNVQDIFTSYSPQSLDGSTTGKTTNLGSDFVVTGTTTIGTQTALSAPNNNNAVENEAEELTATISAPTTGPTGLNLLSLESIANTIYPGNTVGGTVTFSDSNASNNYVATPLAACENLALTAVTTNNVTTYQAQCNYQPPATGTDTITAQYSGDPYHGPSSSQLALNVSPQTVVVTVGTSPAGLTYDVNGAPFTTAQMPSWDVGTNYSLYVPNTTQTLTGTPNTQYVFTGWSNGVTSTSSPTDNVLGPATATTYTANFTTQYLLDAIAGTGGSVAVPAGNDLYYNASSIQAVTATPNSGYVFSNWSGTGSNQVSAASGANTYNVAMSGPALITANFTAVPVASVSPTSINLGTLYLGSIVVKTITISNTGAATMTISDPLIAILPGTVFGDLSEYVTLNLCPKTLAAGKSCTMVVTFIAGPFYGTQAAALTINTNASGQQPTVNFTATVIDPQASFSAGSLSFGTVKTGSSSTKSFVLTSSGGTALSIGSISISGDTTDFKESNNCPASVAPRGTCTISVTFAPGSKGAHSASVVVTDNTQSGSQSVALSGTGGS